MRIKLLLGGLFLFIAGGAQAQDLSTANVSEYIGDSKWTWTIYITGPYTLLAQVNYVEYQLHPTFSNPTQRVYKTADSRYPFGLTASGWGVFEVGVKVVFKSGEAQFMKHMLQFVQPSSANSCTSDIYLPDRRPMSLADPRLGNAVYVYVDEIPKDWTKRPPTLTVLNGFSGKLDVDKDGRVSPMEFYYVAAHVPQDSKWSLKVSHIGDSVQFRYANNSYWLAVEKVDLNGAYLPHLGAKPQRAHLLVLKVCDKPPFSGK